MAYKDEYEVARLLVDPTTLEAAASLVDGRAKVSWKLHPPLLRARGMERKITVGTWAAPGLALLAKGKRLRGTPLDPFGYSKVRRAERKLAADYSATMDQIFRELTSENLGRAIEVASLPATVRGYEDRKLNAMTQVGQALASERTHAGLHP